MTTSAQMVTLFTTEVFNHASVSAFSTNLITYDIVRDSEPELDRLYLNQEINAFVLLISRGESLIDLGGRELLFDIEISYFREKDTSGNNWGATRNAFEAITDRVFSQLQNQPQALFDILQPQAGAAQITQINEFETTIWRGVYSYAALKR